MSYTANNWKFPFTALSRSFIVASWCNTNIERNCNKRACDGSIKIVKRVSEREKYQFELKWFKECSECERHGEKIWLFKVHITMQIFFYHCSHSRITYRSLDLMTIWHYLYALFICCHFNVNITLEIHLNLIFGDVEMTLKSKSRKKTLFFRQVGQVALNIASKFPVAVDADTWKSDYCEICF
jgi:hypothetical protein